MWPNDDPNEGRLIPPIPGIEEATRQLEEMGAFEPRDEPPDTPIEITA